MYCFRNILIRSGREKTRPISIRYRPKVVSHLCNNIAHELFYLGAKVRKIRHELRELTRIISIWDYFSWNSRYSCQKI